MTDTVDKCSACDGDTLIVSLESKVETVPLCSELLPSLDVAINGIILDVSQYKTVDKDTDVDSCPEADVDKCSACDVDTLIFSLVSNVNTVSLY